MRYFEKQSALDTFTFKRLNKLVGKFLNTRTPQEYYSNSHKLANELHFMKDKNPQILNALKHMPKHKFEKSPNMTWALNNKMQKALTNFKDVK